MSFPNIPDVDSNIDITVDEAVNLLLASIAFEELGLAHIINSEAEKIQFVLGTLTDQRPPETPPTIDDLLKIDRSVEQTMRSVIKNQMLLQFKLEDIITTTTTSSSTTTTTTTGSSTTTTTTGSSTTTTTTGSSTTTTTTGSSTTTTTTGSSTTTTTTDSTTTTTTTTDSTTTTTTTTGSTTTTTTTTTEDLGSAWSVGIPFGTGNAEYTTLASDETGKTVVLGLGSTYIPVGNVIIARVGTDLSVTFTTTSPYIMDQAHLYVNNVAPTNSAPGSFPYQYTVTNPADYFTTHTFVIDVSAFAGQTIYIAAHAHILQQV